MAHIGPQVRAHRDKLKWSVQKLATLAGLTRSFVSRIENGRTYYSEETVTKIAGALGVPADRLLVSGSNVEDASIGVRRVPVLDYIQAAHWVAVSPGDLNTCETILTDLEHPASTFALRIWGESMEPQFRAGDVVVIDPTIQPRPGDFVVASEQGAEAVFKQYRSGGVNERGEKVFELHPLNPTYAPMRSDRHQLEIVGVMVEHRTYRRR